ncbi:MAG TPA: ferrochelatase [Candidatus Binatia bacterium]|nr:ferrochelatase [Candidatus Binatia bacterium]
MSSARAKKLIQLFSRKGRKAAKEALSYDAVLLIAFGGPTSAAEVRPFLARVLRGISVPKERIEEVVRHYEAVGGKSPLNEITFRQAHALQKLLHENDLPMTVYVGMRNSRPFLRETLDEMTADGARRSLGFILSPHQTEASWERYQKDVAEAQEELGGAAPTVHFCFGWHAHPLFIQTWVEQIQSSLNRFPADRRQSVPLVFTAHSLPIAMANQSTYVKQLEETTRLIGEQLGHHRWSIAYQSRSGKPTDPWLEPDIGQVIHDLAMQGVAEVVVAPIGFVCDHVEILYDLDIEAKKIAAGLGMEMLRANCPNDHPTFILMMADVIEARMKHPSS